MNSDRLPVLPLPLRIVIGYVLFGTFWIIFSDLLLVQLVPEPFLATLSIAKGLLFIALTALLLYYLIGRQLRKIEKVTAEARDSEERLRLLENNLPDSYVYQYSHETDGTQRFLHLSAGVEKVHGVSMQDVLDDADTLYRQIDPGQLPSLAAAEETSLQKMTDFQVEFRFCRADGEWRWLKLRSRPRKKPDGQVLWDGVATDITESKLLDETLQKQEEFTEKLIESSAAAIFVLNTQHKVILWNKACEELTGFAATAIVGTGNHWQAFYDHERSCLSDIVLDASSQSFPELYPVYEKSTLVADGLHAEGWYQNLNGSDRYIMFDAAPVYDSRGNLLAAIETLQDITRQKRSDENLRLQGAALQAAANAIVITDKSGSIEWVNPAFTVLTGYSAEEAIGKNPRDLVKSGVHEKAFFEQLWDTILKGEVWRGQIMNRHKDGTLYPEGQTITPVKDANGVITHFIAIKRDLTEHRKMEEKLRQSQKMESIGTLAGGIAHDFNNILSAIIGYGQFTLMKMSGDDQLRSYIESILEAADRAAHLTKQLLLFSRKQGIDKKQLDLNLVVARVENFLKKIIGEDIAYNTVLHAEPLPVLADAHQLEQVLMNLATNARDSMPQGGILTVTTEKVTLDSEFVATHGYFMPGSFALTTVSDNGEGMDDSTQQRIFEPFFTTKEVGKGTGLGLAVTYGIIKQHEGYITVYSEPGRGTTFRIYLPLILSEGGDEPNKLLEEAPVGGTETILLAEDDETVRVLTKKLLTEFGYSVIEAIDGVDAVTRFKENSKTINLILSDLIMPNMNGKEAVDEIRKYRPEIKVIFSSGYAPETIQEKVSLEGNVNFIAKPVSPMELLRKVRSVLDGI